MAALNTFLLATAISASLANGDPSAAPSSVPSDAPSISPSTSSAPTVFVEPEYEPGNLEVYELDMYLSKGLTVRIIAKSGEPVTYGDGTTSSITFHTEPDGAAVFADESAENAGGWVYVSNSEEGAFSL